MTSKVYSFLFGHLARGEYAFVLLRLVIAAFWLNSDIPRWAALIGGRPTANGLVRNLFGLSMVIELTYFFTLLETLAAVSFILGLAVRLASVWAVVEFAIIDAPQVLAGNIGPALLHALLLASSLTLLLNGSFELSLDGLIVKRATSRQ